MGTNMRTLISALVISVGLLAGTALAASNGDNNGKPFQDLQDAIDAAVAAESAAREAGDAAISAEVSAETAAREAGDAAAAAAIATEELARINADQDLQAQLDTQELLLVGLDDRVSVLEGLPVGRTITWTETGALDVVDLAANIAGLNVNPNEWVFMAGTYSLTGQEWGICTNDPTAYSWLSNAASGSYYFSDVANVWIFAGGYWYGGYTVRLIAGNLDYVQYLRVGYPAYSFPSYLFLLSDRKGDVNYINNEVFVRYSRTGAYRAGNTITLNVGTDRMAACGF